MDASNRAQQVYLFEQDAEMLAVYQIDLLSQLEQQLRALHHTMRHIEKLRRRDRRVGPELTNSQRDTTLTHLDDELAALDAQLTLEHACCIDMHDTIAKMKARVADLRQRATSYADEPSPSPQPGAEP